MQHETKNRKSANGDFKHDEFFLCAVFRGDGTNMWFPLSEVTFLYLTVTQKKKNLIKTDRKKLK